MTLNKYWVSTPGSIPAERRALTRRYSVAPSGKTTGAPGLEVLKGRQRTAFKPARFAPQNGDDVAISRTIRS